MNHSKFLGIIESSLNESIKNEEIQISGYDIFRKDRKGGSGGGSVLILEMINPGIIDIRWPTIVTAKLSFSRQNVLSYGNNFILQSNFTILQSDGERVINIADEEEDKVDDFIRKYFFKGFTYREICLFIQRNHECIFSITPSEMENQTTWIA